MWLSDRNSRIWYSVIRALRGIIGGNKDCESENCEKEVELFFLIATKYV